MTEFKPDGTLLENPADGAPIRGRYSLQGGSLKVQLDGMAEELAFTVRIKSDQLELTNGEGHTTPYTRV